MLEFVADQLDVEVQMVGDFVLPAPRLQLVQYFVVENSVECYVLDVLLMFLGDPL